MALLQVNNLFMGFTGETLFKNISFSIDERDKIGMIGVNGAGKSTLIKILLGLEYDEVDPETNQRGTISKKGGLKIGYLSQHPDLNPDNTVFEELMTVFSNVQNDYHRIQELNVILAENLEDFDKTMEELGTVTARYEQNEGYAIEYKVKQILNGLTLAESLWASKISDLSGGQLSRVALGKILLEEPELLILDEPTNHLDSEAIEWLEVFLKQYKGTVILISHDRYFLDQVVNRIFEIHNKKLKTYNGNYSDFIKASAIEKELELKKFEDQQKDIKKQEESIERLKAFGREKHLKRARSKEKALAKVDVLDKPEAYRKKAKIEFNPSVTSGNDVLQLRDISMGYGERILFKDLNLDIYRGEKVALIGANGIGKSTLFKIIMNEITPLSGDIKFGTNVNVSYFHQEQKTLNLDNTIIDEIWEDNKQLTHTSLRTMLGAFLFEGEEVFKKISTLSGGERARVAILKLILSNANLLLLDEPTNHLDFQSINWLNNFIMDLEDSIVIVVSHDRHFLNQICTNIVDVDFGKIQMYVGNYDFWYESSQLALQLAKDQNKKAEEKIAQLKEFIARFSSNASKAKQATSRKKQLEKIQVEEIQPSRRRYPYVGFTPEREIGNEVLEVEGLTKTVDGVKVLDNVSFRLDREDKVAFMGDEIAITTLFNILMGEDTADSGTFKWGVTTSQSYLPKNHNQYFDGVEYSLVDWLRQYSEEKSESFIRGFLGRMLFSGEEALKQAQVLSGGEKVRCMLSKLMLSNANVLVLDDPTNHLDLESITSVNKGLEKFPGVLLFNSHDQEMIQTLANRIIEITPGGIMDRKTTLEEYLENKDIQAQLKKMYDVQNA